MAYFLTVSSRTWIDFIVWNYYRFWVLWCTPVISILGKPRQENGYVWCQSGLHNEFKSSLSHIKTLYQGNKQQGEKIYKWKSHLGLWFQRYRSLLPSWWEARADMELDQQLRTHILIHKQEAERVNLNGRSFWNSKPSPNNILPLSSHTSCPPPVLPAQPPIGKCYTWYHLSFILAIFSVCVGSREVKRDVLLYIFTDSSLITNEVEYFFLFC